MKDNTWGRVINPNRNRPGRNDASGAWHWMAMEREGYGITFCLLFAPMEKVVLRGGFDGHVQHRCVICHQAWLYLMGLGGKSAKDLMHHENGWNRLPRFDGEEPIIERPYSRQIKQMTRKAKGEKAAREGILKALPKLRRKLPSNTLPVLVEYQNDDGEFYAHTPFMPEITVSSPSLSVLLADMGIALETQLAGE